MNRRIMNKSLSSVAIRFEALPKRVAALVFACALLSFATSDQALALESAGGNPVCAAIKAEGGSCGGDFSSGGSAGSPASDPIKNYPLPSDFPKKVKNSGLPLAQDPTFGPPQNWPVPTERRTSPEQRCERAKMKCKDNATCLQKVEEACP